MSCSNSQCYLPQPPRAWSRVQNACSLVTTDNSSTSDAAIAAMLNKGNVLQYKANSATLTQSQKYSKIAQGQWVNRNTTWAIQSTRGYTNPNTTSLLRIGTINLAIDPTTYTILGPTLLPPTCIQSVPISIDGLPPIIPIDPSAPSEPIIPLLSMATASMNTPSFPPPVSPIMDPPLWIIQDGGTMICSIQENICTGTTILHKSQQVCNPTTDSDVPGPIQELCWKDGTQTWYPRQRYTMSNSANKWPINAHLTSAVKPYPPVITSYVISTNTNNQTGIVTITWTQDETCIPVASFLLLQSTATNATNISPITIAGTNRQVQVVLYTPGIYTFTMMAVADGENVESDPSNTAIVNYDASSNVVILSNPVLQASLFQPITTVFVQWTAPELSSGFVVSYTLYYNASSIYISNPTTLDYYVTGLHLGDTYTFYVTALINDGQVSTSNYVTQTIL